MSDGEVAWKSLPGNRSLRWYRCCSCQGYGYLYQSVKFYTNYLSLQWLYILHRNSNFSPTAISKSQIPVFFFSQKASISPLVHPNPNLYTPMSGLGPFPGVSWLYLTFQTACYQYPGKEGYTEDCWTWPENQIIKMRNLKNNLFYITTVSSPCVNFINL